MDGILEPRLATECRISSTGIPVSLRGGACRMGLSSRLRTPSSAHFDKKGVEDGTGLALETAEHVAFLTLWARCPGELLSFEGDMTDEVGRCRGLCPIPSFGDDGRAYYVDMDLPSLHTGRRGTDFLPRPSASVFWPVRRAVMCASILMVTRPRFDVGQGKTGNMGPRLSVANGRSCRVYASCWNGGNETDCAHSRVDRA